MSRRLPIRWLTGPVFGIRQVGIADIALATLLSVFAILTVSGTARSSDPQGGVGACIAVLLMTLPVAFARRQPVGAAAVLAVGAALNWVVVGHFVRCGAALPAAFYVAFMVGWHTARWLETAVGTGLVAIDIVCQAFSDPRLGAGVIVFMVPFAVACMVAGRLVQGRNAAISRLRARTAGLREQRERNARLAVAADQARIADDLDGFLHERVGRMAAAADEGREALAARPEEAREAFVTIQGAGRETLTHMRDVVADLREPAPAAPQPVLSQLDRLLAQADQADARLHVVGDPSLLPPGVELSGFRIIEHLLEALDREPAARVDVTVTFGPDALELTVEGPNTRHAGVRNALAAASERAALHGGSLRSRVDAGRRETTVLLPLTAGHA